MNASDAGRVSRQDADQVEEEVWRRPLSRGVRRALAEEVSPGWQDEAPCSEADPDAWFPDVGQTAPAVVFRLCAGCSVRRPCLAVAMLRSELGIWAGTSNAHRTEFRVRLRHGEPVADVLDEALDRAFDAARGDAAIELDGAA